MLKAVYSSSQGSSRQVCRQAMLNLIVIANSLVYRLVKPIIL